MSGICGICEVGWPAEKSSIEAMVSVMRMPEEAAARVLVGDSIALAAAPRWDFQQLATTPGVWISADADLVEVAKLRQLLPNDLRESALMPVAEVLARLYELRGLDFVHLLHGAFSLAIWDVERKRLVLAVDRLGIRTLYWAQAGQRLAFGSRLSAVRRAQENSAQIAPASLMQYLLFSVIPAPLSIFRGVLKLEPGCLLVMEQGQVRQRRYWDLKYQESGNLDARFWATELRDQLQCAVQRTLEYCPPEQTGAYLSGGTDSSSVVAFMTESHSPVNTFSIFFEDARYSEIEFARTTVESFQAQHHEYCVTAEDTLAAIPVIAQYYDEPFANSSAIGAYYCALTARRNGVDTLLAGDGGDELFAGNERYASDRRFTLYHSLPAWMRHLLIEPTVRLLPDQGGLGLPRRYVHRALLPNPKRIFSYSLFLTIPPEQVFEPDLLREAPPETWLDIPERHFHRPQETGELNRLLYMDMKMTIADNDLRKVVGTAELAGVRVRFPLLDDQLAEFSGRLPSRLKMKGFEKRYIFKQAMRNILPKRVLYKKKHGFGVPLAVWLFQHPQLRSMARDLLHDRETQQRGYFRRDFLQKILSSDPGAHAGYYGEVIWYIIALELWHRFHLEPTREVAIAD
jgi:asparagine synthase (glutamine-hydrolysing)